MQRHLRELFLDLQRILGALHLTRDEGGNERCCREYERADDCNENERDATRIPRLFNHLHRRAARRVEHAVLRFLKRVLGGRPARCEHPACECAFILKHKRDDLVADFTVALGRGLETFHGTAFVGRKGQGRELTTDLRQLIAQQPVTLRGGRARSRAFVGKKLLDRDRALTCDTENRNDEVGFHVLRLVDGLNAAVHLLRPRKPEHAYDDEQHQKHAENDEQCVARGKRPQPGHDRGFASARRARAVTAPTRNTGSWR